MFQISRRRRRAGWLMGTALVGGAIAATPALAQSTPEPRPATTAEPAPTTPGTPQEAQPAGSADAAGGAGQEAQGGLTDIVVTAQRRSQNLQDVPVAITALTAASIQSNRITDVSALSGLAPGLVVRQAAGGAGIASFTLRGVTSYGSVPGSEKEVSIYLDGVYIGSSRASLFELPDIERIEVLRGPQGTLFGRNATAGAISIVTRTPTGELGIRQELTLGNYDQVRSRTSVDLPAIGPFSAYGTFVHDARRGDTRNLGEGTFWNRTGPATNVGQQYSPRWLGDHDADTIFVAVKFEPSDRFRTTYKFDREVDHFTPDAEVAVGYNPVSATVGGLLGLVLRSQPAGVVTLNPANLRIGAVNNSFVVPGVQRNLGHSLTTDWKIAGHLAFKNIAAYREAFVTAGTQLDGLGGLVVTPALAAAIPSFAPALGAHFQVLSSNAQSFSQQWSDEAQLNFESRLLTLTAGGIFFHSKDRAGGPQGIRNTFSFAVLPLSGRIPLGNEATSYNRQTSLAGYAQGEVHLLPTVDVVLGGRVTNDDKSGTFVTGGTFTPGAGGNYATGTFANQILTPFSYKNTRFTYSVGVNYKPDTAVLVYAKYSTGFVSGGSVGGIPFQPETVDSLEGGVKADLLDRRLRTNLAVWNAKYNHLATAQSGSSIGRPDLGSVIIDAGGLKAYGAEFETTARPLTSITLGGSVGYTHARYRDTNPLLIASSLGAATVTLQPKWTATLSGQYDSPPVLNGAHLLLRADAQWRSRLRFDPNPNIATLVPAFAPAEYSPANWLVNARLALRDIPTGGIKAEVAIWTRNLTNSRVPTYELGFSDFLRSASYQQARTFGVDLIFQFR